MSYSGSWGSDWTEAIKDLGESYINVFDPVAFQETFFRVDGGRFGLVPYRAYKYQKKLARDENELIIINKSRQTGISTCTVLDKLYAAIMAKRYTCVFISVRQDQANELINKARTAIYNIHPRFLSEDSRLKIKLRLKKDQQRLIELPNESRLMSVSASESAGRSYRGDLVLDEFAHVINSEQIFQAAMQITVRKGGGVRMISTPYGDRGIFADIAQGAKAGNPKYQHWSLHEIHWTECGHTYEGKWYPDLTEERIKERCKTQMDRDQEYELQFLDEATSMFPYELLKSVKDYELPQYTLDSCDHYTGARRFFGIDPGTKINSTGIILIENIKIPEKYSKKMIDHWFVRHVHAEKMSMDQLTDLMCMWADAAKPIRIYVDDTGMGAPITQNLTKHLGGLVQGITLSTPMKEKLVYNMVHMMESKSLTIPDNDDLIRELHGLEREKTRIKGITKFTGKSRGGSDDIAWALALSLSDPMLSKFALKIDLKPTKIKPMRRDPYGTTRNICY